MERRVEGVLRGVLPDGPAEGNKLREVQPPIAIGISAVKHLSEPMEKDRVPGG